MQSNEYFIENYMYPTPDSCSFSLKPFACIKRSMKIIKSLVDSALLHIPTMLSRLPHSHPAVDFRKIQFTNKSWSIDQLCPCMLCSADFFYFFEKLRRAWRKNSGKTGICTEAKMWTRGSFSSARTGTLMRLHLGWSIFRQGNKHGQHKNSNFTSNCHSRTYFYSEILSTGATPN